MATTSWLTEQFMEGVLRHSINDDSINVTDLSKAPATKKVDNYTSEMIRITVTFNRLERGVKILETQSIIVKIALMSDGIHKDLVESAGVFDLEIMMMTTILKEMNSLLEGTKFSGDCLFTQTINPPLLIIEDLATLGFRMVDRQVGLDFQHSLLALKSLAKFHAASVAVCERTPKYKDMCSSGIFNSERFSGATKFFTLGMKTLARTVESWPGLGVTYTDKLTKLSEVICSRVAECQRRDDNQFNVINHGDFWVNNMLFKYDNNVKVIDHIFVDFQLCYYGSPAIDLNYFLNTSPSEGVLDEQKEEIVAGYLEVLTITMRKLGCKTHAPNMEELKKAMHNCEIYGCLSACSVLPLVLLDKSEARNLEEIMTQDESNFNRIAYESGLYKTIMSKRLSRWNDMGLLDL